MGFGDAGRLAEPYLRVICVRLLAVSMGASNFITCDHMVRRLCDLRLPFHALTTVGQAHILRRRSLLLPPILMLPVPLPLHC